ncbi:hypothetical protein E1I18_01780 [Mycoplasmopsis mucosicanis]|uniref:Uncharacterized protein n=1 Tax=Mycoplasmopsis mucosicanis TaxID=458208 RepID=A0A507SKY8_9BACT|nr:hypothetical protein [Mycoplasmopsis mucosicanis]TQC51616.1 hypothetical protein E1I18_01780 [Mycoplasmopsis mucosicanis]
MNNEDILNSVMQLLTGSADKNTSPTVEYQKDNFFAKDWEEKTIKSNKWVKIYYEIIEKLVQDGAIVDSYMNLVISKHRKNFKNEIGQWNFCRHHIDEIKISGAIFSKAPEMKKYYEIGKSILISFDEHLFLHYIIVMAQTTIPNNGMMIPLQLWFNDWNKSLDYWDKKVIQQCKKYSVPYVKDWQKNLM